MKIIELSPGSVEHTLKSLYHSFQINGGLATLGDAGDDIKIIQQTEDDYATRRTITTLKVGTADLVLQLSGPAVETGDNPVRPVTHWFAKGMQEDIAKLLSVFGSEIEVEGKVPHLWQAMILADDHPTLCDVRIVVGQEPGTRDLVAYRAEGKDGVFRLMTIPRDCIPRLAPAPAPLADEARLTFIMQRVGASGTARLFGNDKIAALWEGTL